VRWTIETEAIMQKGLGAACLMIVSLPAIAGASDTEYTRRTLKGIKKVGVIVEQLRNEVPDGLTEQELKTDVEQRLQKAGIALMSLNGMRPLRDKHRTFI
jgi:hypothetical protein